MPHRVNVMYECNSLWILYEKPGFCGRRVALEEGGIELGNMWAEPTAPQAPMVIGSIRLAVRLGHCSNVIGPLLKHCAVIGWFQDYSVPHIDLFTEPNGLGRRMTYCDDTMDLGAFGIPPSTGSIKVHSGV
ncbi:hypothetical protein JZ751_020413 [Albula glossodonta]|uniref:Beta/gamma crystallin 'Greek key' domain-containing protein n=1 Tax=Albula glossodonta TaxID=121402 RepID=A0A8T2MYB9_9TELE|nr:hypothetical protein JZ751_020413 [Albula glossodonta]